MNTDISTFTKRRRHPKTAPGASRAQRGPAPSPPGNLFTLYDHTLVIATNIDDTTYCLCDIVGPPSEISIIAPPKGRKYVNVTTYRFRAGTPNILACLVCILRNCEIITDKTYTASQAKRYYCADIAASHLGAVVEIVEAVLNAITLAPADNGGLVRKYSVEHSANISELKSSLFLVRSLSRPLLLCAQVYPTV